MNVTKLNESYSSIDGDPEKLKEIFNFLKIERPGAYFDNAVKSGFKSPYDYFSVIHDKKLIVMNGHLDILSRFGISRPKETSEFTLENLSDYLKDVKMILPFAPHDFQEKAFTESLLNPKQINKMCTSSGKSLTISLISDFLRLHDKKGLILVPSVGLLSQFKSDIKEYNLQQLYKNTNIIGGGQNIRNFDSDLTISTWQSLMNYGSFEELDYIINDECHRFASVETSAIIKSSVNCKYKWGFTGTLPEDPSAKMELVGMFGMPKTYITARELIDRGLGTPIHINTIFLDYPENDKKIFKEIQPSGRSKNKHPAQLEFIKQHEKRGIFLTNLISKLRNKGNSLVLYQHTNHGKGIFIDVMKKLYPDVEVSNKNITGKKSFEFQEKYRVYFINGEDNAETREKTRKILEEHDDAILIANFAVLGTGTSIKKLHNLVLASPMKAYTTITQSIGRMMRLHFSKSVSNVYDIVDNFSFRGLGGIFVKQYNHRKNTSYNPEEYPIREVTVSL